MRIFYQGLPSALLADAKSLPCVSLYHVWYCGSQQGQVRGHELVCGRRLTLFFFYGDVAAIQTARGFLADLCCLSSFSVSLIKDVCCFLQRRRNSIFSLIMLGYCYALIPRPLMALRCIWESIILVRPGESCLHSV